LILTSWDIQVAGWSQCIAFLKNDSTQKNTFLEGLGDGTVALFEDTNEVARLRGAELVGRQTCKLEHLIKVWIPNKEWFGIMYFSFSEKIGFHF